jgi:hypothetical protein
LDRHQCADASGEPVNDPFILPRDQGQFQERLYLDGGLLLPLDKTAQLLRDPGQLQQPVILFGHV